MKMTRFPDLMTGQMKTDLMKKQEQLKKMKAGSKSLAVFPEAQDLVQVTVTPKTRLLTGQKLIGAD
ncbi:MAG: hypothetical protein QF691_12700 [SAR324 cluster bacterium]|nr:hypothetical protein [SAR324 cluster bacterium]